MKSKIRIAASDYVLVATVKKRLNLDASLYSVRQIFALTQFEELPIQHAFAGIEISKNQRKKNDKKIKLFVL